ncbi:MAG: PHB depolymerase family esterase, partial [Pseudomonadota bacterium]|nr:PHB depolymerase family esterase [Pseudomonadota bacterium]
LIAGITREVAANHPVDSRRIFVAGLSAGAAMAVILGQTYPELYAGVGAHSGLPYAAAHDLPSALAAMKGQGSLHRMPDLANLPRSVAAAPGESVRFVPTIVFHGDRDRTVHQGNGTTIVQQASAALDLNEAVPRSASRNESGVAPCGRRYSRSIVSDASGLPRIESWVLHGAGHAWSGGDASGTYTDGTGPDASAEMVRFFLAQPLAGSA